MSFISSIIISSTIISSVWGCTVDKTKGLLPKNKFIIPTSSPFKNSLDERTFNEIIDKVSAVYSPIVGNLGAKLIVERFWDDPTVNAFAGRMGNHWKIYLMGGLARHPKITADGFALTICHELGHHLGGHPKIVGNAWSSVEGQADYFATSKCLRKVFRFDDNISIIKKLKAPKIVLKACKTSHVNAEDVALCVRLSMAGKSSSDLYSDLGHYGLTSFTSPDPRIVKNTKQDHPNAQCRLDTLFQGSLCDVSMNDEVSDSDEVKGTCHPSLGHKIGNRPLCWFKPSK